MEEGDNQSPSSPVVRDSSISAQWFGVQLPMTLLVPRW
jgi:hypothetical protein